MFSGQAASSPLSHIFRIFRLARGTHSHVGVIVVCDGFSKLLKIIVGARRLRRLQGKVRQRDTEAGYVFWASKALYVMPDLILASSGEEDYL